MGLRLAAGSQHACGPHAGTLAAPAALAALAALAAPLRSTACRASAVSCPPASHTLRSASAASGLVRLRDRLRVGLGFGLGLRLGLGLGLDVEEGDRCSGRGESSWSSRWTSSGERGHGRLYRPKMHCVRLPPWPTASLALA